MESRRDASSLALSLARLGTCSTAGGEEPGRLAIECSTRPDEDSSSTNWRLDGLLVGATVRVTMMSVPTELSGDSAFCCASVRPFETLDDPDHETNAGCQTQCRHERASKTTPKLVQGIAQLRTLTPHPPCRPGAC